MSKKEEFKEKYGKHLGQMGSYAIHTDQYDPTLLVAIPRTENREKFGITGNEFVGYDVWHCHEGGYLLDNGLPIAGTLKIVYSSTSQSMVESKSFKLYLNSFDMYRIGTNDGDLAQDIYCEIIKKDLRALLNTHVEVDFFNSTFKNVVKSKMSEGYTNLVQQVIDSKLQLEFTDFEGKENHLTFIQLLTEPPVPHRYKFFANNLRSRCHITSQKDTGNALITIVTKPGYYLNQGSLLKQIVSLREVEEFHENCAEKLYQDIMSTGKVEECSVILLYARRGSLDINPIRCTNNSLLPMDYLNVSKFSMKEQNQ